MSIFKPFGWRNRREGAPLTPLSKEELNAAEEAEATWAAEQAAADAAAAQAAAELASDPVGSASTVGAALTTHTALTTTAHGGIVASTDSRLTNARTPLAHASTHAEDGTDPLTTADLPASVVSSSANVDMCKPPYNCVPGEDVTARVNEAIEKAVTAGANVIDIRFSVVGVYLINGAVKEGEAFGYKYKGQILLPARTQEEGPLVVRFIGAATVARALYLELKEPTGRRAGVVLKSNATTGNVIDVIPGYHEEGQYPFSNIFAVVKDLTVECPQNPECGGINFKAASRALIDGVGVEVESTTEGNEAYPTGTSRAIQMPGFNHDGFAKIVDSFAAGFPVGLEHSEQTTVEHVFLTRNAVNIDVYANGLKGHMSRYSRVELERATVMIRARIEAEGKEGGGTIEGTVDIQNEESGLWATTNVIEDVENKLNGNLAVFPQNHLTRGFPVTGAHNLNISNPYYGSVGWMSTYPVDDFRRIVNVAGVVGTCSQTSHPWRNSSGELQTATTGETTGTVTALTESAKASVEYIVRDGVGSRIVSFGPVKTGESGNYNVGCRINTVIAGTNAENELQVNLHEEQVNITIVVKGVPTILAVTASKPIANNKTYEPKVIVTHPPTIGPPTRIEVYLGTTLVLSYQLTEENREALSEPIVGVWGIQDGIRFFNDLKSTIGSFRVLPSPQGATGATGAEGFNPSTLLLPTAVKTYTTTAGASENRAIKGESVPRAQASSTLLLTSGTPVIAAVPLPARTVIHGVAFYVSTVEGTPANRTHLWGAMLSQGGSPLALGLDYKSSTEAPMEVKAIGLWFEKAFETGEVPAWYNLLLCEVMSSTNPITIAAKEGGLIGPPPILAGTGNAGQATPAGLPSTVTVTAGTKIPWLAAF